METIWIYKIDSTEKNEKCTEIYPVTLCEVNVSPITHFCLRDAITAGRESYPTSQTVTEQNGNFEIEGFNSTDPHPKISTLLEIRLEGLMKLLAQEQPSIEQDEAFIEVEVNIAKSSNVSDLPNYVHVSGRLGNMLNVLVPIGKLYELGTESIVTKISTIERPMTFGSRTDTETKSESVSILSPKQQVKQGIEPMNIICKEGLDLIFKSTDNSPACVKPETAKKLIQRGWGTLGDVKIEISNLSNSEFISENS